MLEFDCFLVGIRPSKDELWNSEAREEKAAVRRGRKEANTVRT